MRSVNRVSLLGYCASDPEYGEDSSGRVFSNIVVITNEYWTDKIGNKCKKTEYHNVVFFNALADLAKHHLMKNSRIFVDGHLHTRERMKCGVSFQYTEIIAHQVSVIDKLR